MICFYATYWRWFHSFAGLYDFTTSEKLIHFSADHVLPGAGFVIRGRQVPCGGVPPSALMPAGPSAPSAVDPGRIHSKWELRLKYTMTTEKKRLNR